MLQQEGTSALVFLLWLRLQTDAEKILYLC